jgi:hypothetical protein
VTLAALGLVLGLAVLALRRGAAWRGWIALAGMLALLANPQNLMLGTYWPSYRSSFYAAAFLPVLLIAALAARPSGRGVARLAALGGIILALQTTLFIRLSAERTEVQRRDLAFAERMVEAIEGQPETRGLTEIRMHCDSPVLFYRGILENSGDTNRSIFASCWAHEAVLFYATGRHYVRIGDPTCPATRPSRPAITVHREGEAAAICF